MKTLGLALGAGGSRGIAHVGFLKALEEAKIKPDYIVGCSMGAVVGGCYAIGMTADEVYKEAQDLKVTDLFDLAFLPITRGSLLKAEKLRKKLSQYYEDKTFNDTKIPFGVVATDFVTGETVFFSGDDNMVECISASSSIPMVFRPAEYKDRKLVDGGVRCRVPVEYVKDMGADVVVAIDVLGELRKENKNVNIFSVMTRLIDIYDSKITELKKEKQPYDLWLEPDMGDMSQYKIKNFDVAYEAGYALGKKYAPKIKKLLK